MGLFTPGYFSKDKKKRTDAIRKLDDKKRVELFQSDLRKYSKDPYAQQRLREELLDEIRDQSFLASLLVALDKVPNANILFIEICTRRLTDPVLVNALYAQLSDRQTADRLIDRVTDPALLKRIALDSAKPQDKRVSAIQKLKDGAVARQVLLESKIDCNNFKIEDACVPFLRPGDTAFAEEMAGRFLDGKGLADSLMKYIGENARDPEIAAAAKKELLGKPGYRTEDLLKLLRDPEDLKAVILGTTDYSVADKAVRAMKPDRDTLYALIEAVQPENKHVKEKLLEALAVRKDEKDIPYFREFLNAKDDDTVELGLSLLSRVTGLSRNEVLSRYGTTRCAKLCVKRLKEKAGGYKNLSAELETLKTLYAAGIGKEVIETVAGKKLRGHTDENYDYCNPSHADGHNDLPEVWVSI